MVSLGNMKEATNPQHPGNQCVWYLGSALPVIRQLAHCILLTGAGVWTPPVCPCTHFCSALTLFLISDYSFFFELSITVM